MVFVQQFVKDQQRDESDNPSCYDRCERSEMHRPGQPISRRKNHRDEQDNRPHAHPRPSSSRFAYVACLNRSSSNHGSRKGNNFAAPRERLGLGRAEFNDVWGLLGHQKPIIPYVSLTQYRIDDIRSNTYIRYVSVLTYQSAYLSTSLMGRKKKFSARLTVPLSDEMLELLDGSLDEGEPRLSLIRDAIAREIEHRRLASLQSADHRDASKEPDPALSIAVREIIAHEVDSLRSSFPITAKEAAEIRRRIALIEQNLGHLQEILGNPDARTAEEP